MKKKGLCILLSAAMLALSFTACSKKNDNNAETETKVDANGTVYVEVTDKKGKNVTEKDGSVVTSVLSEKEQEKVSKENGKKTDAKSETEKKDDAVTGGLEINSKVIEAVTDENEDFEFTAAAEELIEEGTTLAKKTTLFEDKVQKTLKTGKFTIEMNVQSGGTKMPMKLAFDKNKMYASFSMSGLQAGILYKDNTAYLLFPNIFKGMKAYMEYPDMNDSMSDVFDSFNKISDNGANYVGSSKVKIGKKDYICEEYKSTEDGTVFKYYFDGSDWKRYECISDEENMIYEITSFSGKVDDSLFSLKGYTKVDENAFAGAFGGLS